MRLARDASAAAPWEAREGASPLTGNGAEAERLESAGEEELGGLETGAYSGRAGDTLSPRDLGWEMGAYSCRGREAVHQSWWLPPTPSHLLTSDCSYTQP